MYLPYSLGQAQATNFRMLSSPKSDSSPGLSNIKVYGYVFSYLYGYSSRIIV